MMRDIVRVLCCLLAGFVLVCVGMDLPAWAQGAQTLVSTTGGVDFGPLATNAITACVMFLTVAAGILSKYGVSFMASKMRINDSAAEKLAADRLNDILHRAIDYAEAWAKQQVADPTSPIRHVQIDNFFVAQAVSFALSAAPDLIQFLGLTETRIRTMIIARLNSVMPVPEVNSGSPPTYSERAKSDAPVTASATVTKTTEVKETVKAVETAG